ncbi:MAG: OB-fold nucleic acid binding domain-containing protein [Niabella sp.]|nr:OB-fold nucleic acid binding domain-containing protein [Niabella sp.]
MKIDVSAQKKSALLLWMWILIIACNRAFDVPAVNADPDIPVNMTIGALKERYQGYGIFQKIYDDITIAGIVTANDRSGNFYKQIVIQDETGAIPVLLDGNNVYTAYPVGRRVFVKLKGMMLGDYGGAIQLGLDSVRDGGYLNLGRIPVAQFDQFIVKGSFGNEVAPRVITPAELSTNIKDPLQSMLVQLEGYQFAERDTSKTYADPEKGVSAVNFTIRNCERQSIVLRNSSYASFAALKVPSGNGTITGIYSIFNATQQLFIRDTGDVQFLKARCGQEERVPVTIAALRQLYQGANRAVGRYAVGGTVISDAGSGNIAGGLVVLQNGQSGLLINFGSAVSYRAGDSIVLLLSDTDSLINERGALKLKLSPGFVKPDPVATERVVIPVVKTLQEVHTALGLLPGDAGNIEGTLIRVLQAVAAPDFFSGGHALTDGSGTLELYTREEALFATAMMPPGPQTWTGYTGNFNGVKQFYIRNTDDVSGFVPSVPFILLFGFAGVSDKTGTVDPTPVPAVPNLVVTPFKAVGVGDHSTAGGRFSFTGWPMGAVNGSDTFSGFLDEGRYYEVTIAPSAGFAMHLFRITFTMRRSATGVRQLVIRSGLDGFKTNLVVSAPAGNANVQITPARVLQVNDASTADNEGCTVTMGAEFTNLDKPVAIRFYGFNSEAGGGTFSIDDVQITGSVR